MLRITIVCQCVLGKFMKWKCFSFSTSSQTNIAKYRHPAYIRYSLTENGEYAHGTIPCVQARAGKTDVRKIFWVTNYTRKTFSCFCEIFCNFIVILPHFPEVFSEMFLYVSVTITFSQKLFLKGKKILGKMFTVRNRIKAQLQLHFVYLWHLIYFRNVLQNLITSTRKLFCTFAFSFPRPQRFYN